MFKLNTLSPTEHLFRLITLLFSVLYLISCFVSSTALTYIGAVLLLVMVARSLPGLTRANWLVYTCLFLVGAILLVWKGAPLSLWATALMKNANLVCLLVFAPMVSMPFFYEDYQSELKAVAQTRMRSLLSFCLLVAACSHILGVLISVAAITIIYDLLSNQAKLYDADDIFMSTLVRCFGSSSFWSPSAAMIVITSSTDITWLQLVPIGIALSVILILFDLASVKLKMVRQPDRYPLLTPDEGQAVHWPKVITMLALAVIMILMIVIFNLVTDWDLMVIVPVVSLIFPVLTALVQHHMDAYRSGMANYYATFLDKVQVQVSLYTSAGFLGMALQFSGVGERLPELIPDWLAGFQVGLTICLMLIMMLPALLGIHPVVTSSALLASFMPEAFGMTQMTFVLIIITGWLLSTMWSPFCATCTLAAGCCGRQSWDIGLGMNGIFTLVSMVVFSIIIAFIGPILS